MKRFLVLLFITACTKLFSQDSLQHFNYSRNKITLTGMKVLGSWGIANISFGAAGWSSTDGSKKFFYQMNTMWGAANFGFAILGYTGSKKNINKQLTKEENLRAQRKIETTFIINDGLDLAYIGTGIYLNTHGNNKNDARLKGYGSSVIMQGIFLLLFDGTMYKLQRTNGNKFKRFLDKNFVMFNGNSVGVMHSL